MPGTNLTREEAATRSALVTVDRHDVELDVTTGAETFATTSTIRFSCSHAGAETFLDFVGASVEAVTVSKSVQITNTQNATVLAPVARLNATRVTALHTLAGKGAPVAGVERTVRIEKVTKERLAQERKAVQHFRAVATERRDVQKRLATRGAPPPAAARKVRIESIKTAPPRPRVAVKTPPQPTRPTPLARPPVGKEKPPPIKKGELPPIKKGEKPPPKKGEIPPPKKGEPLPIKKGEKPPKKGELPPPPPKKAEKPPPPKKGDPPPPRKKDDKPPPKKVAPPPPR